jgi:hypothetical protein
MMMDTGLFRADINTFFYFFVSPLLELPWKVVSSPMELKVLISLKPFTAYFTQESVGGHESFW